MVVRVQGTRYLMSSLGYRVHGFESMGYLVSRVLDTQFRGYRGTGYGIRSFSLPITKR